MIDEVDEDMVVEETLKVVLKLKWFWGDAATLIRTLDYAVDRDGPVVYPDRCS